MRDKQENQPQQMSLIKFFGKNAIEIVKAEILCRLFVSSIFMMIDKWLICKMLFLCSMQMQL